MSHILLTLLLITKVHSIEGANYHKDPKSGGSWCINQPQIEFCFARTSDAGIGKQTR
jgi:hypothetical protein